MDIISLVTGSLSILLPSIGGIAGIASLGFSVFRIGFSSFLNPYLLLGVGLIVASGVSYHFIQVSGIRYTLQQKTEEAAKLAADNQTLQESNRSLEASIQRQREVNQQILTELSNVRQADSTIRNELSNTQNRLRDTERSARQLRLRENANGVDLFINALNRDVACRMNNFGKPGDCRNGEFIPAPGATR